MARESHQGAFGVSEAWCGIAIGAERSAVWDALETLGRAGVVTRVNGESLEVEQSCLEYAQDLLIARECFDSEASVSPEENIDPYVGRRCAFCKSPIAEEKDQCPECGMILREHVGSGRKPLSVSNDESSEDDDPVAYDTWAPPQADYPDWAPPDAYYSEELLDGLEGGMEGHLNGRVPGSYLVSCPHCRLRSVETAQEATVAIGMLIVWRTRRYRVVGCSSCVRAELIKAGWQSLFLGLWCIPWGVFSPFVAIGNFVSAFSKGPGLLQNESIAGIRALNEHRVGQDGLSTYERWLAEAVMHGIRKVQQVGGLSRADLAESLEIVRSIVFVDDVTVEMIEWACPPGNTSFTDMRKIDKPIREALMRLMALVATTTAGSSDVVFACLEDLAKAYGVAFDSKEYKKSASEDYGDSVTEEEVAAAYEVLGLTVGVPMTEVKSAYKRLLRKHHPDVAAGRGGGTAEATIRTQLITAAYYIIVEAAA